MDKQQKRLAVIIFLAALIVAGSFYGYWQNDAVQESTSGGSQLDGSRHASGNAAVIFISGAVNKPGLYKLNPGSRVVDAIKAAGGLSVTAVVDKVNLAQVVKDGMHINVPEKPCVKPAKRGPPGSAGTGVKSGSVNINTADKPELMKLPGVGPTLAGRIMTYRKEKGPFRVITDIMKVAGVGEAKFRKLKDRITL